MKRLLAMALALVLALGLAVPALAEEPLDPFYTVDSDYVDPYAEYEAAHAEELANLDVDALLAGWEYQDMTAEEQFMKYYGDEGQSLEEAVKERYISKRLLVEEYCRTAEEYRAEYPEMWESFDADSYFETELLLEGDYTDKAAYMAYWNIITQEEFADDMFVGYMDDHWDDGEDWGDWNDWGESEPDDAPTLTLMVNGVASDATVTAVDGVSYVDADALRAILGDKAVGGDVTPVPVRAAAQAAGWDVAWYGGGWWSVDQEIQLWDKAAFEAELAQEFGPLNDFMAKAAKINMDQIFSETPISGHETVEVNLTRFSTLDGNKDYKLRFTVDYVAQKGVMDVTITFDVSQLLQMLPPAALAALNKQEGVDLTKLTQLLKAGKMEFIVDYNKGALAYNVPLLAFMDEEQAGWHTVYLSGLEGRKALLMEGQEFSYVSTLYDTMVDRATFSWNDGAADALKNYRESVDGLSVFVGKDRFVTQNGKTTWSVTTQVVNRALGEVLELEEPEKASFFKAFDMRWALDDKGNKDMSLHIRPDMEGIAAAAMAEEDDDDYLDYLDSLFEMSMGASLLNMDITASGSGNQSHSSGQMKIHWNNVGTMEMKAQDNAGAAAKGPRQVEEVAPAPVFPAEADVVDPGFNFGVVSLPEQDG